MPLLFAPVVGVVLLLGVEQLPDFAQYGLLAPLLLLIVAAWWRAERRADRLEQEVLRMAQANADKVVPALEAAGAAVTKSAQLAEELVGETKAARSRDRDVELLLARYSAVLDARA